MINQTPLVSVIIPVYNVMPYLRKCVASVTDQTYENIEVILVDDGSTDGSSALCDELVSSDGRLFVFHKENGGLSDARNFGLRHAHGEWISFVDSDDWVSPIFIEALLDAAISADCQIATVPFGKPFKDGSECVLLGSLGEVQAPKVLQSIEIQRLMLYQTLDTAVQWHLFAKPILGVDPFPVGLYYEDLASVYRIIHRVDRVALVDERDLYAYRMRGNSIIRQAYSHIKGYSAVFIANQLYGDISNWYPELAVACSSRCFSVCRMVYGQVPKGPNASEQDRADREALWGVIEANRDVVASDSKARPRERLAANIARMGEGPFSGFCSFARRIGLMQ